MGKSNVSRYETINITMPYCIGASERRLVLSDHGPRTVGVSVERRTPAGWEWETGFVLSVAAARELVRVLTTWRDFPINPPRKRKRTGSQARGGRGKTT